MVRALDLPRRPGNPAARSRVLWVATAIIVLLGIVVLIARLEADPRRASRLTVANDTPYDLSIELRGRPSGAVTPLGVVAAMKTFDFQDVIDQGGTWYVHVTSQGRVAADVSVTRRQLEAEQWRIEFGSSVTTRLQQAGAQPLPYVGP